MSEYVTVDRRGEVAVVTIDNPPVNALSLHMREPLHAALVELDGDASVKAVVVACAGRTFVSGADISEFGSPKSLQSPNLPELCAKLETLSKPSIAAIHGTALGGGFELALSCHFRVADKGAKVGLPEVHLGLVPGSGGTVRLPRVVGAVKALEMIVSGKPIGAADAQSIGAIDAVAESDLVGAAVELAQAKIAEAAPLIAVRDREDWRDKDRADLEGFDKAAATLTKKARGLEAPLRCAEAVRNSLTMDFDAALMKEREIFLALLSGDQSKAQRHLFFAEREATKIPDIGKDVTPREVKRVGIIGAGTMGGGIAMAFANGGLDVTVLEMNEEALDRGFATIRRNYEGSVKRGSMGADQMEARLARFSRTTDYADLADCDLIIEAVFEEMGVKKEVFGKIEAVAKPGAILATNTSYLDVDEIAASTKRPQDVVGLHFFSPANVMKLLEIVRGKETAPDVIATALAVARRIAKVPVVVGVCHGFVGNRMLASRSAENEALLLEGATPEQIDRVFIDFGWPMGPFAMGDLAGLDIGWRNRKALGTTAVIADALCEMGRYGQKTQKGFYLYEEGSRTPKPDPEVARLIEEKAREAGVDRREISDQEITERTLYPMINEGARILEEGIALRASDIDVAWIYGYGFPRGKGGPMFFADLEGLAKIVERLEHWHGKTGNEVFEPARMLKDAAAGGKRLAAMKSSA
ncbi:MAG: 3-hydroxyacyl-CoA dehydrogenase NAD-binding domain-containing protein [Rhizobiaceae bacterium]